MGPSQFRFATHDHDRVRWLLARNCSITPRQLMGLYLSFCVIAACVSCAFWWNGAPLVAPFAVLELVLLGTAFLVYARHARDAERITLEGALLTVEIQNAGRCMRTVFQREWVRVQRGNTRSSLVELCCRGQVLQIGRYVRPELRQALATELAVALRTG